RRPSIEDKRVGRRSLQPMQRRRGAALEREGGPDPLPRGRAPPEPSRPLRVRLIQHSRGPKARKGAAAGPPPGARLTPEAGRGKADGAGRDFASGAAKQSVGPRRPLGRPSGGRGYSSVGPTGV